MATLDELKNKHPQYFEGILQLRGCSDEIINWTINTIAKDKRSRIAKNSKVRGGIDLYLTDQHYLQRLGKKLKETFGGIVKKSSKLHTLNKVTGRDVHRVNILFRPLPVKLGKFFNYNGEEVKILKVSNKLVNLISKKGKKSVENVDVFFHNFREE